MYYFKAPDLLKLKRSKQFFTILWLIANCRRTIYGWSCHKCWWTVTTCPCEIVDTQGDVTSVFHRCLYSICLCEGVCHWCLIATRDICHYFCKCRCYATATCHCVCPARNVTVMSLSYRQLWNIWMKMLADICSEMIINEVKIVPSNLVISWKCNYWSSSLTR